MGPVTRRVVLGSAGSLLLSASGLTAYAGVIEPVFRLVVTRYDFLPPHWPDDFPLKIVVVSDIHACEPWMSAARIRAIAERANSLSPDLIVMLGDYNAGHDFVAGPVMPDAWGEALSVLKAPLGVYSVLGNHDWWHGPLMSMHENGASSARRGLAKAGIRVLENQAVRLVKDGNPFWLLGLGDQMAHGVDGPNYWGNDDLKGTIGKVTDAGPMILLAHEPYIIRKVPENVSLTLCGHTHGGQVNLPFLPPNLLYRRFRNSPVYGHVVDGSRHMIISAGLGASHAPVRFLRPPEIVEINITKAAPVITGTAS